MMEFNQLGPIVLGSQLKKLSDKLYELSNEIYQSSGFKLQSRWLPIIKLLSHNNSMSVTELARQLGQSHSAISQISKTLASANLIKAITDPTDDRKRLLKLTDFGKQQIIEMQPLWSDIEKVVEKYMHQSGQDLMHALLAFEHTLNNNNFVQDVLKERQVRLIESLIISDYKPEYRESFKTLNIQWLEKYFYVEEIDEKILSHPEQYILDSGGKIFFSTINNKVIGTCALINKNNSYELSKMAVDPVFQGLGVGKALLLFSIDWYKKSKKKKLYLESNSKLIPAISLYKKLGFQLLENPNKEVHYQRANVYMEYKDHKKSPE